MVCDYNFLWHPYWKPKQKSEKLNNMKKWNFKNFKSEKVKYFHKIEIKTNWFLQSHAPPPNGLKVMANHILLVYFANQHVQKKNPHLLGQDVLWLNRPILNWQVLLRSLQSWLFSMLLTIYVISCFLDGFEMWLNVASLIPLKI